MSSPVVNIHDDLPPGLNFAPTDEQLIRLYLLPRVRGQADPFPGLIVEDDTAANTQPWELFSRHGRPHDVPTFFYVRTNTNDARAVPRPDRRCHGGGSWKSQKRVSEDASHELLVDGEKIKWSRHNLNLNMGSGSVGWVMHEYSITGSPSLKICRVSFSGHGQKRKHAPDDYDEDCLAAGEPLPQRARVTTAANSARSASWTTTTSFDQDFGTAHASEDQEPTRDSSDEAMVAEMTNAPQPNWEFQEQGKTMEQLGTMQLTFAPQEPAQLYSAVQEPPWMMMLDQELPSYDDIKEMFSSLPKTPADGGPCHYQQFDEQVPAMAMEQKKVDQGAVMMPGFGGAQEAHLYMVPMMEPWVSAAQTVQLPSTSQEPAQLYSAGQDPWMVMIDQALPSYDDIAEFLSSLPKTKADGDPYHNQQFDEQAPAMTMDQKVDQGAVMMPTSFSGAQDNMDSMAVATQDDGVHWGGFHFC